MIVHEGFYLILNARQAGQVMDRKSWEKSAHCGAMLNMSVMVNGQLQRSQSCPRCCGASTCLNSGLVRTWWVSFLLPNVFQARISDYGDKRSIDTEEVSVWRVGWNATQAKANNSTKFREDCYESCSRSKENLAIHNPHEEFPDHPECNLQPI